MKMDRRRGVSEVVATLLMLAIVVVLGTMVFAFGSTAFSQFSQGFSNLIGLKTNQLQETYVVEYVQFNGTSPTLTVVATVRNVGTIPTEIASIAISNLTDACFAPATCSQFLEFSGSQIHDAVPNPSDVGVYTCATVPGTAYYAVEVGQACSFRVAYTWVSGTAYNIVVSSARGNTVTLFWKA